MYESNRQDRPSRYRPPRWMDFVDRRSRPDEVDLERGQRNTWRRLAGALLAAEIEPVDYVIRVFAAVHGRALAPPLPNCLLADRYRKIYARSRTADEAVVASALRNQVQTAAGEIRLLQHLEGLSMERATFRVLEDESLPLSALFRYCLAAGMPQATQFAPLKKRYRAAAAVQYLRAREAYDKVMGPRWLPEPFIRRVEDYYLEALQEEIGDPL